ncbi:MAG: glucose-1-phosphate thymidylyltransferase [Candidatus Omnitrophica bacterium]|nr:glucose-1-phosphate thymidylyltransferase [Candidatus Omnitrophota bacterium]
MKGLILCGGKGTRLRPLTYTRSKPLLPIANKPIVEYVLRHIHQAGITDIGIVINPTIEEEFKNYFQSHPQVRAGQIHITLIMQEKPLGLAHAVKTAQPFLGGDDFLLYLGDNILEQGPAEAVAEFKRQQLDALIFLKEVPEPQAFGVAVLDEQAKVVQVIEKPQQPPSHTVLVGVYLFSAKIFEAIDSLKPSWRGEYEITDAIQHLIDRQAKVQGKVLAGWWLDTGKKDDILSANSTVLDAFAVQDIRGEVDKQSKISGRVAIGAGSVIINSTIRGPAVIGEQVRIENSFIGPYTSIGDKSQIFDSGIEHAVILNGVYVQAISRLEDSLIGEDTRVVKSQNKQLTLRLMIGDSATVEI